MTRKELIESIAYLKATVNCYLYDYKIAKNKKQRKKVKKIFAKWIRDYAIEYSEFMRRDQIVKRNYEI